MKVMAVFWRMVFDGVPARTASSWSACT